ncbi:heterogeneous nuclear ribonucleoprotein 1-like protein [Tanacetum coccineum]
MDSDEGKVFLGGISWDTSEERINDYFSKYGVVSQTVIMRDKITGRPRGFGFVVFSDPSVIDNVVNDTHNIDGRNVTRPNCGIPVCDLFFSPPSPGCVPSEV